VVINTMKGPDRVGHDVAEGDGRALARARRLNFIPVEHAPRIHAPPAA
jgi:hypothetical protein